MGAVAPVFFVSVVAVLYVGLCIVVLLWGGVICQAEKGLVLCFFWCVPLWGCCVLGGVWCLCNSY